MPTVWKNFKPVLLGFISMVLASTAVLFMLAARHETTKAMTEAGEQAANGLLDAIMLDISSQQAELMFFKEYAMGRYKRRLQDVTGLVAGMATYFHAQAERGLITMDAARAMTLESASQLRFGRNDYFFVYDRRGVAVGHANPAMIGRNMSHVRDKLGRQLMAAAWAETEDGRDFFDFIEFPRLGEDKMEAKLVYFKRLPEFDLIAGTGVYVGDIEEELARKKQAVIDGLRQTLDGIRIANTGYLWLFTGSGEVLAHPGLTGKAGDAELDKRAEAVVNQFIRAAHEGGVVRYDWKKPDDPNGRTHPKVAWVRHFAPLDWYLAASVYEEELAAPAAAMLRRQSLYLIGILIMCLGAGWVFAAKVTSPLSRLSRHAQSLAANDFASPAGEDEILPDLQFPNEIKSLASTITEMEAKLADYLQRLTETATATERIRSELRIANRIQMDMLPGPPPRTGPWAPLDIFAMLVPAKEVGGDLFDYFLAGDGRICLVVGDVSGKGVPAALFMAQCKALARGFAQRGRDPGTILGRMDAELSLGNAECMFVTLFLALVDTATGEIAYACAGHNPPLRLGSAGGAYEIAVQPGLPLALDMGASYPTDTLTLAPGEGLLLYTDGVTEAQNAPQELFGAQRLERLLQAADPHQPSKELAQSVLEAVEVFEAGAERADDITIVAVRYLGGEKKDEDASGGRGDQAPPDPRNLGPDRSGPNHE